MMAYQKKNIRSDKKRIRIILNSTVKIDMNGNCSTIDLIKNKRSKEVVEYVTENNNAN